MRQVIIQKKMNALIISGAGFASYKFFRTYYPTTGHYRFNFGPNQVVTFNGSDIPYKKYWGEVDCVAVIIGFACLIGIYLF